MPLQLRFPSHQRFADFEVGNNAAAVAAARCVAAGGASMYLTGPPSSGKTHLLIAACQDAAQAQYLPLAHLGDQAANALAAVHATGLIGIDEIDALAENPLAQIALFDLFNRLGDASGAMLLAARVTPLRLPLELPDLVSRLASLPSFDLAPLDDDERRATLIRHASRRGLELDDVVLDFLFRRQARDLSALMRLLDRIDRESLAAQRRVTVPFLRRMIGLPSDPAHPREP
ncbi:MAG: DnaA regulatory inactivator Hda [Lysobacterales bacterium]